MPHKAKSRNGRECHRSQLSVTLNEGPGEVNLTIATEDVSNLSPEGVCHSRTRRNRTISRDSSRCAKELSSRPDPDFLPRIAGYSRVCCFRYGKQHEVRQRHQAQQEIRGSEA